MDIKQLYKVLLASAGVVSLSAGIIGIFIPILPTTPFLLLAAFCFLHSSKRMHEWLLNHKVFGPYIQSYMQHRALKQKTKVLAIATLWASLGLSLLVVQKLYVSVILLTVGILVSIYLLSLKTLTPEMISKIKTDN